jgi:putative salt-induced outer membrane protein YdiY
MMRLTVSLSLIVFALSTPAFAQEVPEPAWKGALGLSFVSTGGNSDTQTLGLDFGIDRKPEPWGVEIKAAAIRAEDNSVTTAERYNGSVRGKRGLGDRWEVFGGGFGEQDKFSGYDLRYGAAAGGTYKALLGPTHTLSFDAGLTWTKEELVDLLTDAGYVSQPSYDYVGGIVGLKYAWQISDGASLSELLTYLPNFDESGDWRAISETALQAAISSKLALKLGYLVRYDHEPAQSGVDFAGGPIYFDDTDTTTTVSVVWSF